MQLRREKNNKLDPQYSTFDGRRGRRQSDQSPSSFITYGRASCIKQAVDASDETGSLTGIGMAYFINQLDDNQLENFTNGMRLKMRMLATKMQT